MNSSKCPVPKEQHPTNEFLELSNSRIFSWPKSHKNYSLVLISTWLATFLLFLFISSGSVHFEKNLSRYFFLSLFTSISLPLLLTIKLFLGWNHIFKRLTAEKVEYEESGWYDGQTWVKPLALREKENLIASIEVKPILKNLKQILSIIIAFILFGILLFQYINI